MSETAVLVVVEIVSVQDRAGLKAYSEQAGALIGSFGGEVIAQGAKPVGGEAAFAQLVIQRWPSESAFRVWLDSDSYRPLDKLRLASATMRAAIVPIRAGVGA